MATDDLTIMQEAGDEAVQEFLDELMEVIEESMGPDGEVPGMLPMGPRDRIADTLWMAQLGAMDVLKDIAPWRYEQRRRQLVEDMKASPFIAHTYEG